MSMLSNPKFPKGAKSPKVPSQKKLLSNLDVSKQNPIPVEKLHPASSRGSALRVLPHLAAKLPKWQGQ